MKLLMALAVLVGSVLPDVRVVAWWGIERLDRLDRLATGREVRRAPVDRGIGLTLTWWCCIDHPQRSAADPPAFDGSAFEARDATIDEMDWSPNAAEWSALTSSSTGLHALEAPAGLFGPQASAPPHLEPGRTGLPFCTDPCPDSSISDLIAADEARALAALRSAEGRR